ncbi:hypothetical protein C4D60_Mb05t19240 [Musa balbisiana]|uniref:Aminotransferase class I/classII large domain-containing protein n=1 Tax=Musa balbisiana TaxID=52838 RepID=A0A4S8JXA7_MUSBA|nr:hypothetical protein C4D60_Mb05t19240 [Musa balbisiana]
MDVTRSAFTPFFPPVHSCNTTVECRERSIDGDLVTSRLPSSPAVFGSIRLLVSDLKLNLGVGAYRLNVDKKVEKQAYAGKRQHQMDLSSYYMDVHTIRQELIQLLSKGKRFADAIQEKNHIPFFDVAYQGFASGSHDADAHSISLFVDRGLELLVAQSYSKKLGLVKIQLKRLARAMYSNPPVHGARIVANIVRDRNLFEERKQEMELMAGRIKNVRRRLHENLSQKDKHAGVIGLLSSSRLACPHILV